jgi:hypothetical protein
MPDGHNGPTPTREDFEEYLATDLEIGTQIAKLNKQRATNMAQYEAATGGDRDEIRIGRKLEKLGADYLSSVARVAGWMHLAQTDEDGQSGFLSVLDADAPPEATADTPLGRLALARAGMDGYNSGWAGGSLDGNPWPVGSEAFAIWRSNCADGIAQRADMQDAKDAKKELKDGVTHIDPAAVEAAQEPAPAPADKPKRGRRSKGLTPNGPTAEDVAEQTAGAKAGWSASDFTGPAEIIH